VYKSIEHRAITNDKKARTSLATFVVPNESVEIGPLHEMADGIGRPAMYRTVKVFGLYSAHFRKENGGESAHTCFEIRRRECKLSLHVLIEDDTGNYATSQNSTLSV